MRYQEMHGPLEGWTYDERGVIYTTSGYRTTARQIEFCMWMYECMRAEVRQWMIRSDERPGALRPVFESGDLPPTDATLSKSDAPTRTTDRRKHVSGKEKKKPEHEAVTALRAPAQPPADRGTVAVTAVRSGCT